MTLLLSGLVQKFWLRPMPGQNGSLTDPNFGGIIVPPPQIDRHGPTRDAFSFPAGT
jgi:hypothetical protein